MKVLYFFLLIAVIMLMIGCSQVADKGSSGTEVFAAHVAELRSMETTLVVTKAGPEGYISTYWARSGLSRKYTLSEYKSAVIVPSKGVDVDTPVEGNRFIVPWPNR